MFSHEGKNLKESLTQFGQTGVKFAYHEPSNTHIAYYMAIGRHGIKGFGHTADFAFEQFMENLDETVKSAPADELKYWSKRCEMAANVAKRQAAINEIASEPLSCQIGMAVPKYIAEWLSNQAEKGERMSRNQLVTDLLRKGVGRLEERVEAEFTVAIAREIKKESGKGEVEWSQHVTPDLQAGLILIARRFDVSLAMLARYIHVKEYKSTTTESAKQHLSAAGAL